MVNLRYLTMESPSNAFAPAPVVVIVRRLAAHVLHAENAVSKFILLEDVSVLLTTRAKNDGMRVKA